MAIELEIAAFEGLLALIRERIMETRETRAGHHGNWQVTSAVASEEGSRTGLLILTALYLSFSRSIGPPY